MTTAPAVEFVDLRKVFGDCVSVACVSAKFESSRIHAVLGENGAGKSTLMKLLFGLFPASEGSIYVDGQERDWKSPADAIRAGLGMVQQHFTLVESLSVIDNIMLGAEATTFGGVLDRDRAIADLERDLPSKSLRLEWHRKVSQLSVGEKQKVEILKLIARRAQILVLDEPTAVLSPLEIEELFAMLKGLRDQGRTIFVITHKLGEVFDHCDTWFVLRAGRSIAQGEVSTAKVQDVVRAMVGSEIAPLALRRTIETGELSLQFLNVSILEAAHPVRGLSFEVRAGEVLGVAGVDGSGQAEVIETLLGLKSFVGEIEILGQSLPRESLPNVAAKILSGLRKKGLALVSEDRHQQGLWLEESVELNAAIGFETENGFTSHGIVRRVEWREHVSKWLKVFDVRFNTLAMPVSRLSGGNQQKLIFARELLGRPVKLLVAHQPTRGVDFGAVRLIHERIIEARDQGAAVLIVSSELDELMTLSDRILVLCGGRQSGMFVRGSEGTTFNRESLGRAMTDAAETKK